MNEEKKKIKLKDVWPFVALLLIIIFWVCYILTHKMYDVYVPP